MLRLKSLKWKMLLPIMAIVMLIMAIFSIVLYQSTEKSINEQGERLVQSTALGMNTAIHAQKEAEHILEQEMLAESVMASYILAQGATHQDLKTIAKRANIDEIWSTDDKGNTTITSIAPTIDFNFGSDPNGQAAVYMKLIDGTETKITQPAQKRDVDNEVYKFVGVGGWQQPQIVQVARNGQDLVKLEQAIGVTSYINKMKDHLGDSVLYAAVARQDGTIIHATHQEAPQFSIHNKQGIVATNGHYQGEKARSYVQALDNGDYLIVTTSQHILAQIQQATFIAAIVAILLIVLLTSIIIGRQVKRVTAITHSLQHIATGDADLTKRIDGANQDEIGQLVQAFNQMMSQLQQMMQHFGQEATAIFTSVAQVQQNTAATMQASKQITTHAEEVQQATTTQLMSTNESAQAMDELARSIQHTSESVAVMATMTNETVTSATSGGEVLQALIQQLTDANKEAYQTAVRAEQLTVLSQTISTFTETITAISDQTNLLALNASIEAARAGDAGKGFAVVAEEVRQLADASKQASDQIAAIVGNVHLETQAIVTAVNQTAQVLTTGQEVAGRAQQAFTEIVQHIDEVSIEVNSISSAAEEVAASTEEIAATFEHVADGSRQTAKTITTMTTQTKEQQQQMHDLNETIIQLEAIATSLQHATAQFKA